MTIQCYVAIIAMKWLNSSQATLQFPILRFGLILILIVTLFALSAILIEGTISAFSLCRIKRTSIDKVLKELWVTRKRVGVVTAGSFTICVLAKSMIGIIAVNGLQIRPLRLYFLLQVMIVIQTVILIHCNFHSAAFFMISSASEMSSTALLLLQVRKRSGIKAAVVVFDGNAIEMQQQQCHLREEK